MKETKKKHYSWLTAKSSNNITTTWNIIKKETGKVHSVEQIPTWLVNDKKLKDPKNVANAFNNAFITITENLNIQQIEKGDAVSILKDSFPGNSPSINITKSQSLKLR